MNIKASKLKTFLTKYRKEIEYGDKWLDKIPGDVNAAFFDNGYVNSVLSRETLAMEWLFGDLHEEISWFLYEWSLKNGKVVMPDGTKYNIKSLDEYIAYLVNEHLVEDDIGVDKKRKSKYSDIISNGGKDPR